MKMPMPFRSGFVLAALVAGAFAAAQARPQSVVLKNFTLLDGTGREPVAHSALVMADGHVSWVGPAAQLKAPAGASSIDLTGKFVIPGMIDAHVHVGTVNGLTQDIRFYTRELVESQLRIYAAYGVTTALVLGTDKDLIFDIRARQRTGHPDMTRVFTAGQGLIYKGSYGGIPGLNQPVATASEARAAVDEQAKKGVDLIKFWVDDEFGTLPVRMPAEISQAIIDEAHRQHLKVVAHIFYLDNAKALVGQGVDALAHSVRDQPVDEELLGAMQQQGTWQLAETLSREASFTYTKLPFLDDPLFTRSVSPAVLELLASPAREKQLANAPHFRQYAQVLDNAMTNTRREVRAGVKYGMGTDSGPPGRFQGYFAHWELQLMVQAGLTPVEALTAATGGNAKFLGAKDLGTLEASKWADLIVLDENPVTDIRHTRTIRSVYIAGQAVPTIWSLCVDRPASVCSGGSK